MKTVILCGGYGTRIRDVSEDLPKPMLPIGGRPILWHIMKGFAHSGLNEFVLCLGYKSRVIKEFFLNYEAFTNDFTITLGEENRVSYHDNHEEIGWTVTMAETGAGTMTGGRISRKRRYIGDNDTFLLTYGDGVSDIDLSALVKFHRMHGKILTVSGVRPPGRFGEIEYVDDTRVSAFNEKPQAAEGCISGGFFVCQSGIFDYLSDDEDLVFEERPMRQLAAEGEMMVYRHEGFWQCMDTQRDFSLLNGLWNSNAAPWRCW